MCCSVICPTEDVLGEDKEECIICLDELRQGDTIARLPCLCIYHKRYLSMLVFLPVLRLLLLLVFHLTGVVLWVTAGYGPNTWPTWQLSTIKNDSRPNRLSGRLSFLGRLRGVDLIALEGANVRQSVGTSVCPQKVCLISMKFGMYIEVNEWCMTVCRMTQLKVKVTGPLKCRKLHFSKSISSATYRGSWQLTTNS